ncbi:MAG TPA: flippase [Nitrospirota bacterium]|nr:flippase [Nitrospirota bacterium]
MTIDQLFIKLLPAFIRTKLEGRIVLQKTISNAGWLLADNIIRLGFGLIVVIWLARYLGPDQFGLLSFAAAFVLLFSPLSTWGLDGIVVRNILLKPEATNETLGTTFALKLLGGFLATGLSLAAIYVLHPDDSLKQWLIGITAAATVFQALDAVDFWFQSQIQSKYTVFAKNASFLVVVLVKIILIVIKAPLLAFAWAGLIETFLGSIGLAIAYKATGNSLAVWHASFVMAKRLLQDSWPLILSGIVGMIYLRIDQVMLGEMVSNEEVGIYSAAVRVAEAWYFVPMAVFSSVYPSVVEAKTMSDDLFYERLQRLYKFMAFIGYAVAVPASLLSGFLINILYGARYHRAGAMLAVLVWAGLFVSIGVARSSFLMSMNWTKLHFMTVLMGSLLNVVLNLALIPLYGGMGASIASCAAYWLAAHGSCFLYRPLRKTGLMLTKALIYPKFW